jgi:hypothetical protein
VPSAIVLLVVDGDDRIVGRQPRNDEAFRVTDASRAV